MGYFEILKVIAQQPKVLLPLRPLILLSHMRANTSLAGHILGHNPDINGYYEMHIGYYSWKSFFRQRLAYAQQHTFNHHAKYMFDKVLHNEHFVSANLLNHSNAKVLISLRSPEKTIPSIIKLYERVNPSHEFATVEGATRYYINRIEQLGKYSTQLKNYLYYDAEQLRTNTKDCLNQLTDYLQLQSPLQQEFKTQKLTGTKKAGDSSGNLNAGTVKQETDDYKVFDWKSTDIESLTAKYHEIKMVMQQNCAYRSANK